MNRQTRVLGHRGWSAQYPENTRLAFVQALLHGADGLEFDVQLSADGIPVVIHDATLDRTTDSTGLVRDCTAAQLQSCNAAHGFPGMAPQPVPLLKDVLDDALALCPDGCYNIEIKVCDVDWRPLVDAVAGMVDKHALHQQVLYSSFTHEAMAYLKETHPQSQVGLLFEGSVEEPWQKAQRIGAVSVHLDHRLATPALIADCHRHGIQVAVWTVDEPAEIRSFIAANVDVLISNRVDVAVAAKG